MEKWHLVARAGDFLLVVWCGENPALQYNGAFLLSRHRTAAGLQPAAEQQFREVLARVLTRLSLEPDVLLAALETFVHEPTLDWASLARTESGAKRVEVSLGEFTKGRVDMAREKLSGGNPSAISARYTNMIFLESHAFMFTESSRLVRDHQGGEVRELL